ncbi:hypothetical protein MTO98_00315 [Mucilaginibacter sp. SMC90]|uniref:imm11 family protein n=1 Tax=Mucilaginibacter sp. SMC90 TaxID=2929803 RepID=UPI001FB395FB|nr:DUF1629 domain-containing protein [Mucilaginibacter sp. SMC90]UOE49513.1 hypothetical protein MTO98_00315 [Mucilaginibacter sp. SMC90]
MEIINSYFLLGGPNNSKAIASAFAPEGSKSVYELINDLDNTTDLPFELKLFRLSVQKGGLKRDDDLSSLDKIWLDYLPNDSATPLFSEKLKATIDSKLTGHEGVDWISVKVNGNNEQRIYFLLRFKQSLDVLDVEKTIFIKGTDRIIVPCFSHSKIKGYTVFTKPTPGNLWKIPSAIYVSQELKGAIQKEQMSGLNFEKVRVS